MTWQINVQNEMLDLAKHNAHQCLCMVSFGLDKSAGYYARRAYHCALLARPDLAVLLEDHR